MTSSTAGRVARATILRLPRVALVWIAVAATAGTGAAAWQFHRGGAAPAAPPIATARRGDIVVSVGGVGRVAETRASGQISLPISGSAAASGSGTTQPGAGGGASQAPANAVFPGAAGRVSRLLVSPGERVAAGDPLVVLDDGGTATGAVLQARNDLATTLVELQQKRTSDPLTGLPPTPEELLAGRAGVFSARQRLARLQGPPTAADISLARSDLKKAEGDLDTLLGGSAADRADAIAAAETNAQLAQQRLDRVLAPPNPADVAAAEAELRKAEADLADLLRLPLPPPPPETLAAARQAVVAARAKLDRVLAPADPSDVTAARLDLQKAQAELRRLRAGPTAASLAAARQAVAAARAKLAQLMGPPLPSDVAATRLDLRKAKADLAVLRARGGPGTAFDVELARLKVAAARARLALAQFTEQQLTVRSPSSGTVTGVLTAPGAPVDASTPVATVVDLDHLAVNVDVSEFDAAQVRGGLPATVRVDALGGKPFPGKVLFVGLTGVESSGVVTFPVRIGLTRVAGLKPGMNVSVRIVVTEHRKVVNVPLEAVARDDAGHPLVTVVSPSGRSSERRVRLGLASNKDVEIRHGLQPGERVVLGGP